MKVILLLLSLLFSYSGFSQSSSTVTTITNNGSTTTTTTTSSSTMTEDMLDFENIFGGDDTKSTPFISFDMGPSTPDYKGTQGNTLDRFKVFIGYDKKKIHKGALRYKNFGLTLQNYEYRAGVFGEEGGRDDRNFSAWQFFFTGSKAYGWNIANNFDIFLGSESGWGFSRLSYGSDLPDIDLPVRELVLGLDPYEQMQNTYKEDWRVGEYFEATLSIRPIKNLSFEAGFQRDLILPRWLVWHSFVSSLTQGVAEGLSDLFVNKVIKINPKLAPIVYFILENGINYGFFELRKDNMNWPLSSAEALVLDSFTLGFTFHIQ